LALVASFLHYAKGYFGFVVHHFPTFRRPRSNAKNALSAMTTRRPAKIAVEIFPLFINVLTHCRLTFSLAAASFTIMYTNPPS
jgi:hypothetical protein